MEPVTQCNELLVWLKQSCGKLSTIAFVYSVNKRLIQHSIHAYIIFSNPDLLTY
jgi:hypothetical protein